MQFPCLRKSAGIQFPGRGLTIFFTLMALLVLQQQAYAFWPFAPERQAPAGAPLTRDPLLSRGKVTAPPPINHARDFQELIQGMANELFRNLEDPDPEMGELGDGVLVCAFVDLKKLYRTSSFGRYLAEQMMTEMQNRHYTVVELRKSKAVLVQERKGEYGLSRQPEEIRDEVAAGAMLTGTYTPVQDHVIVNAKIIDNRTAALLSSTTLIFPRNKLINQLLTETASASPRQPEPVYMKRLEL